MVGITTADWSNTTGKLILVLLQSWGESHGNQYETYRWFAFWQMLAECVCVVIVLLIPALSVGRMSQPEVILYSHDDASPRSLQPEPLGPSNEGFRVDRCLMK
jgi:hypothetical protein